MKPFHRKLTEAEQREMQLVKWIDRILNALLLVAFAVLGYAIYIYEPPLW